MPNFLAKFAAFLMFVLFIIFMVYQNYQSQDELAYQTAYQATTDFADNVRMKGYISPQMVEDFEADLEVGTYLFKTEYTHQKKVYTPIYTDPMNPATFTGEYVVDYDEYYKGDISEYLFKEPNGIHKDNRKYLLTMGDFFYVHVENMTKTKATMLFEFLTNSNYGNGVSIAIPYGGMVLNEDF